MKKVDLMIFDFDGTIADTGADLVSSINHTLTAMRLNPRPSEEILSFVGDGVKKLIEKSLGENYKERLEEAIRIFSGHYEKHLMDQTVLCPHIEDVLKYFNHKMKVILTNKHYHLTLTIAHALHIDRYFMEIVGADTTPFQKPDLRVVEYLLTKYNADPRKTVIIGDGVNDIAVAKYAGILSCAYLNGLGNRQTLLRMEADFYCEDLIEINSVFQ
ncbi:MAG TPA: HAD family hydrolase [Smithellaceae bacterium]|nr:HAD family hydrolase [Smithellaceae bacterium]HRY37160.1 HAD family hydrolase [Smithellaceae bacterium]